MVRIRFQIETSTGKYKGFSTEGHAEFAEEGEDIVCSAISALTINTVNSIEELTDAAFEINTNQEAGSIRMTLNNTESEKAQLLLESLILGLEQLEKQYGDQIICVERQEV